jgi:hypothetical protein
VPKSPLNNRQSMPSVGNLSIAQSEFDVGLPGFAGASHCGTTLLLGLPGKETPSNALRWQLEVTMRKYEDAVAVARICMRQSTRTDNPVVADELRLIAKGYQMRAAAMSGGVVPYIGEDVTESACSDHAAD